MILFFKIDIIFFTCSNVVSLLRFHVLSTSKQQSQVIKSFPVIIVDVDSKSKEIIGKIGILNPYKINIQVLDFMFRVKNSIPSAFQERFPLIQHKS